jgi:hypothetical protein
MAIIRYFASVVFNGHHGIAGQARNDRENINDRSLQMKTLIAIIQYFASVVFNGHHGIAGQARNDRENISDRENI